MNRQTSHGSAKGSAGDEKGPMDDFELIDRREASLPQEELDRIVQWLAPTAYLADSGEFKRHLAAQAEGTGIWLTQTESYQNWLGSASQPSLWIKGVPGAGKSVMAASLARHLQQTSEPGTPVLFFFFRHIVQANQTPRALVRDLLAQALPHSLSLQATLKSMVESTLKQNDIPDKLLWECLLKGLASPLSGRVYCVVDALDEMDAQEGDAFFSSVNGLASHCPGTVKLLITSRPKLSLQRQLRTSSIVHLNLDEERIHHDIRTFVSQKLRQAIPESKPDELESLVDMISRRSAGLFLCARLLVDQLLPALEHGQAVDIDKMPLGLQDMYNRVLFQQSQIPGIDTELQVFLLGCVTHSFRPLRLRELAALLQGYTQSRVGESVSLSVAKLLARQACGPLLDILDDETVQVLHHSLTEYLLDPGARVIPVHASHSPLFPLLDSTTCHMNMAMMGMRALESESKPAWQRPQSHPEHSFTSYAQEHWVKHLKHTSSLQDLDLFECLTSFCRSRDKWSNGPLNDWINEMNETGRSRCSQSACISPLYLAAYAGHTEWSKSLIHSGSRTQPELQQSSLDTDHQWSCLPIWWAVLGGNLEVVEYLLPLTQTSNIKRTENGEYCWTDDLIELAVSLGQADILQRLLKAGLGPLGFMWKRNVAETQIPTKKRPERLRKAMRYYRDVQCLAVTLPYLGKELQDQLLCLFAEQGNADAVECILKNPEVNPNASYLGKTALYGACQAFRLLPGQDGGDDSRGYETVISQDSIRCVELLLASGASVQGRTTVQLVKQSSYSDICDLFEEKERTSLHALMGAWHDENSSICEDIFSRLITAGADLEARDRLGDTPLLCLFPSTHAQANVERPLRFLLERGANASAVDAKGSTLLHRTLLYHRNPRLVQLLVDHGVDVNALGPVPGMGGQKQNLPALALLFLERAWYRVLHQGRFGDKTSRKEKVNDWAPENKVIIQILVDAGANIDADGSDTVLLRALPFCDAESLKLILGSRKNPETVDRVFFGLQTLQKDKRSTNDRPLNELVAMLVAAGGSLEARDASRNRTPLLMAVNDVEMFRALLSAGADRYATDQDGNGVLHVYVGATSDFQRLAPEVAQLRALVDLGFDPRGVNVHGDTLLHMAIDLQDAGEHDKKPPELIPMLTTLIGYGVSPNSRNSAGMAPLHTFLRHLSGGGSGFRMRDTASDRLDRLLQFFKSSVDDLDVNIPDNDGLTPLHYAAMSTSFDSVQCLETLFSFGASITTTDNFRRNALHLSCIARNTSSTMFLLNHASTDLLHARDSLGRTPLFYACASGLVEAVSALIDAGSDVNARDSENLSPLHACATFPVEQACWDRVEHLEPAKGNKPSRQLHTDSYRPYYVDLPWGTTERRRPDGSLPESALGGTGRKVADSRVFLAPWLESPGEAIYSVVRKLVSAGAVYDDSVYAAAWDSRCEPMLVALIDSGSYPDVESATRKSLWPGVAKDGIPERGKEEAPLLKNPVAFLKNLNLQDIDWLLANHANLSTPFRVIRFEPNWSMKTSPTGGEFMPHAQPSFVQTAVLGGLVSFVERLGRLARCYDSPDNRVDAWAVRLATPFQDANYQVAATWTVADLIRNGRIVRSIQPLVYLACTRRYPNLEMLKVLVECCGADPNAREMRQNYFTGVRREMGALTALGYMSLQQDYWHLSAIRYLVGAGADVNVRDLDNETPLLIACNPAVGGRWRKQFIKLLLELGADPNLASDKGTTCLDFVSEQDIVDMLVKAGASQDILRQGIVHKAIQTMEVQLMKYSARYGANFNVPLNDKRHSWKDAGNLAHSRYPIVGTFVQGSRRGVMEAEDTPEQKEKRIAMLRYLLQNGADPFVHVPSDNWREVPEPFLHLVLRLGGYDEALINVFFEPPYAEKLNWETRDSRGRTTLLASCGTKTGWNVNYLPKSDSSIFHARLLKLGVDITTTDNEGMNLFHTMLINENMPSSSILSLLSAPVSTEILSLILNPTKSTLLPIHRPGHTPLDYALANLRPAVVHRLLDLGARASPAAELSPAHQVLSQCFNTYLHALGPGTLRPTGWGLGKPTDPDHTAQCLNLRARLIECNAWDPTTVDDTGTPAWFAFALNREPLNYSLHDTRWEELVPRGNSRLSEQPDGEEQCRTIRFWDAFLGDKLDFQARNMQTGETVLHVVAGGLPKKWDRELFEWLVKKGLDPLAEDNKGKSSLDVATDAKKEAILDLFRN